MNNYFNNYAQRHGEMHPFGKAFYELLQEVEKLPTSEQQTKIVTMISELANDVAKDLEYVERKILNSE